MAEVFVEQIIKRRTGVSNTILRVLAVFVAILSTLLISLLGMIGFSITIFVIYAVYLVFCYTSVEYEYSFLNGELSIDRILGQRKRKTIANFDIAQAEIIAKTGSEEMRSHMREMKKADFSSGYRSDNLYSMILNGKNGQVHVLFEPNERVIEAMKHARPNIVKTN